MLVLVEESELDHAVVLFPRERPNARRLDKQRLDHPRQHTASMGGPALLPACPRNVARFGACVSGASARRTSASACRRRLLHELGQRVFHLLDLTVDVALLEAAANVANHALRI